jgi:hypothetical protein
MYDIEIALGRQYAINTKFNDYQLSSSNNIVTCIHY